MRTTHYNYRFSLAVLFLIFLFQSKLTAQFTTNGTATQTNADCYRLTANTTSQQGSIFNTTPVDFNSDFAVSGTMNFGNNNGGADGITFILTNSTSALGTGGGDIGYGGILTSVIIEFDTWQNTDRGDPVQDHMGITSAGQSSHTGITALSPPVPLPNLEDGQDHCFVIAWSAASQTLSATIDGFNSVSFTGDIPTLFFNNIPNVFYGFTSSTGGASNEHNICFNEPILVPMEDQQICEGESIQLQADPNGDWYNWALDLTLSSLDISNPTATPTMTTLYNVTIGSACGSPLMDDVLVTVVPAPSVLASSNSPLCTGATLELSASGTGTFSWTGPDGFNSNLQNPTIPNVTTANQGEYTVEIVGPDGCENSASIFVLVLSSTVVIVPQSPLCQNETQVELSALPAGGTWGGVADINGFVYPSTLTPGMHTISYSATDGSGCQGMDEITIEILPAGTIDITSPSNFCATSILEILTATPTGGTWGGEANAAGEINPQLLGEGTYSITYSVGDADCSTDTTFMIEVVEQTTVSIMTDSPFCVDSGIQIVTANEAGGTWGGVANAAGEINPQLLGEGTFEVNYTTNDACPGFDQTFIDISPLPTTSLGQGGNICPGYEFPLEINLIGASPILVSYTIDNIPQVDLILDAGTTILNVTTPGVYEITGIIDANNCEGTGSNSIEIIEVNAPQLETLEANCNATQTAYQVTFEISGGDPATYMVTSDIGGSFSATPPYIFTSDFIPADAPYSFWVTDENFCETLEIVGSFSCECLATTGLENTSICEGEAILLAGEMQTTNGMYVDTLINTNGCDSILTTTLTILETDTIFLADAFTCNPAEVGTFSDSYTNQFGCDSTEIVNVILSDSQTYNISSTTCNPGEEGVFTNEYTATDGCDSIVIETISLLLSDTIYLPDSFTCNPAEVGTFSDSYTNQFGCDSTEIVNVILSDSQTYNISSTTCNPGEEGVFTNEYTAADGCDSIVIETISLLLSDTIYLPDSFTCNPDNVGTFSDSYTNQFGCDSTEIVNVILSDSQTYNISSTTCNPGEEGVFTNEYTATDGCDSIVIETISLLLSDTIYLPDSFTCNPDNVGTFSDSYTNQFGCDSTEIVNVILSDSQTYNISSTTCNPGEEGVFTNEYTATDGCDSIVIETISLLLSDTIYLPDSFTCNPDNVGTFSDSYTNQFGCDSTEIVNVILSDSQTYNISSTTCNPGEEGVFTNEYTATDGCDSIVIETISLLLSDTIYLPDSFTCNPDNVGTFSDSYTNQFGCDSTEIVNVILSDSQTYNISSTTCNPGEEGVFTNEYTAADGCDSIVIETISLLLSDTIYLPNAFTCNSDSVGTFVESTINQFGCDSTTFWTIDIAPSDLITVSLTTCDPDEVGEITMLFTNQFGCDSIIIETTTLLPVSDCGVNATVVGSTIPCEENTGSFTINVEIGQGPFNINWIGAENGTGMVENVGESVDFTNLSAGIYEITITGSNGFSINLITEILQNSPPDVTAFITSDYNGFEISCFGENDGTAQAQATNGQAPYNYFWSNGETTSAIENLIAASYSVTITDALDCENETEIILNEPESLSMIFEVSDLDCFGQNEGTIIAVMTGGVPPYYFFLNDSIAQSSNIFTGLTNGIFTISVEDANGCKVSETVGINAPLEVNVELGENLNIDLGDNEGLTALTNIDALMIDSVNWTGIDSAECPDCLTQFVAPLFTTTYSINITAENGCSDSDDLTIFVDRDKNIFVPSAFTPDDDLNNLVMIFAADNTIASIKEFKIINRWGNMIFEYHNFLPNDPTFGWNGNFRGQAMNTGVYVWYAVVEFIDGETEVFKGDVTLIR